MSDELVFLVKGSSPNPYETKFIIDGSNMTAICTCPAGTYGNFCKHRISILEGDGKAIVSDNADKVATITDWVKGTDVEAALATVRQAEKVAESAKYELTTAKKALAAAMND
jgi:hypothetical protein